MQRFVTLPVVTEVLTHDTGHWCRPCGLPSGIRQWVVLRFPTRMTIGARGWCEECGGHDIELRDDA